MAQAIQQLGYLGFGVSDFHAWEKFVTEVLGMKVARRLDGGAFTVQMDRRQERLFIVEGDDDLAFAGWEVADDTGLEECRSSLAKAGVEVVDGTAEEKETRQVKGLIKFKDPSGNPVEIFHGPPMAEAPFDSEKIKSAFVADEMGLGHLVISTKDRDACRDFYIDVLGFKLSDHIICDLHGFKVDVAFLHVNGRHHSLAMGGPMPKRIHHFMLEVQHLDDVGLCFDRALDHGVPIKQSLGRHPNDRMFSFYAETPSGFQFEFGWGGRIVDDATHDSSVVYDCISEWGHRPWPKRSKKPVA